MRDYTGRDRNAVETLSKNVAVPLLEKLLADPTIHEYEIDTQAIHTAPWHMLDRLHRRRRGRSGQGQHGAARGPEGEPAEWFALLVPLLTHLRTAMS
jgi:hypothetical protein